MAGNRSRNKGQRGEREVIKLIQPIVDRVCEEVGCIPIPLERNLIQAHKGGADLHGLDWLALEVKYQETENLTAWWRQCVEQAKEHQTPILFYRRNFVREWRVKMYGHLLIPDGPGDDRTSSFGSGALRCTVIS